MALVAYATAAQLSAYLPTGTALPDDANRLLRRASETVDDFVLAAYSLDTTGLARDADVREALVQAACAQVEFWMEVGEEHDVDGIRGGLSVPGATYESPPTLAPRARSVLTRAGLMNVGGVGT